MAKFCWILLTLVGGYALTVLVYYPGYSTVDAQYVYADAQLWQFGDWQSPAMGVLWRLIDPIAPGALSMFLLTVTLYWLGFGVLALMAVRQSIWLGLITPLLALAPPAFFFVGLIWRDVLFGVVWLVAAVLAFAAAEQRSRRSLSIGSERDMDSARSPPPCGEGLGVGVAQDARPTRATPLPTPPPQGREQAELASGDETRSLASVAAQVIGLLLIAFGVLLRPNAVVAAPLLAAYVLWPARVELKRTAIAFAPALILFCVLVPLVYYGLLGAKRQNPLHSILVFDLGGITHFTGENQFPVAWNAEQTALLTSRCYDPVRWDSYWYAPPCPFVMQRLEQPDDLIFGTPRLLAAWGRAVAANPLAYLAHRATFMWQFLARSNLVLPVWDWAPADAAYGKRRAFQPLLRLHDALQPTLLFRPGLWLVLAGGILILAWRVRATPAGALAVGVTASAVVYVSTFFAVGVAADFRYAYWCVLAALVGAVAAALAYLPPPSRISRRAPSARRLHPG